MKIIFCAELNNASASGYQRLWALQQCQADVYVVNKGSFPSVFGRATGKITRLFKQPRLLLNTKALQKHIKSLAIKVQADIIWLEWPREFDLQFILDVKHSSTALLLSFQDDNPWGDRTSDAWIWRNYLQVIPGFDLHIVKRSGDVVNLAKYGAKHCRFWKHGVYAPLFHLDKPAAKKYGVTFVGTCIDGRQNLIRHLLNNNIPVHVFGNKWQQRCDLPRLYPANFHPAVEGEAYAEVIRQSQICLGLVSHSNKDEWTMRTYEVPGCGGLLLAERTAEHEALFTEGKEMLFFSTADHCVELLKQWLPNPENCEEVGRAALQKCVKSKRMIEDRMKILLTEIAELKNLGE